MQCDKTPNCDSVKTKDRSEQKPAEDDGTKGDKTISDRTGDKVVEDSHVDHHCDNTTQHTGIKLPNIKTKSGEWFEVRKQTISLYE